jgi:hypothetical protein
MITLQGKTSRWFGMQSRGTQGFSFTPTLFIEYHSNMDDFNSMTLCFFIVDDLAAVIAGQIGITFTDPSIDMEQRLHSFVERLEFYSIFSGQTINDSKTETMFSARATSYPDPMPCLRCGEHTIKRTSSFKYWGH